MKSGDDDEKPCIFHTSILDTNEEEVVETTSSFLVSNDDNRTVLYGFDIDIFTE